MMGHWGTGGGEKRVITVFAHLAFCYLTPGAQGHPASVPERPLPHHMVCEHYLVFEKHSDRLERGFSTIEIIAGRDRVALQNRLDRTLESPCTGIRCKETARWRWVGKSTAGNQRWKKGEQSGRHGTASTLFDLIARSRVAKEGEW